MGRGCKKPEHICSRLSGVTVRLRDESAMTRECPGARGHPSCGEETSFVCAERFSKVTSELLALCVHVLI